MKRYLCLIAVTVFTLALTSANVQPGTSSASLSESTRSEGSGPQAQPSTIYSRGNKIKILFHGLMVGRYKPGRSRFQVGIVNGPYIYNGKEYPHKFSLQVLAGAGNPENITVKPNVTYVFEVLERDGKPSKSVLIPYEPQGEHFDQLDAGNAKDDDKSKDYRYAPDIEGMHEERKDRRRNSFKHVFHVYNGVLKSECLTGSRIQTSKDMKEWNTYGYVAEILGVEYNLLPRQKLILRSNDKKTVLWECTYQEGIDVEARVLNLAETAVKNLEALERTGGEKYLATVCKCERRYHEDHRLQSGKPPIPSDYHFQLYYEKSIDVPYAERFRLRPEDDECIKYRAVFPYQCGIILQGKTTNDIDNGDMP